MLGDIDGRGDLLYGLGVLLSFLRSIILGTFGTILNDVTVILNPTRQNEFIARSNLRFGAKVQIPIGRFRLLQLLGLCPLLRLRLWN